MRILIRSLIALFIASAAAGSANAATVFTQVIGDVGPGRSTITFDEFGLFTDIGGGTPTSVPGHDVTLNSSRLFRVFDLGPPPSTPPTVPGFFEGRILAQPTGSIDAGSFFVDFTTDVMAGGLVLANNLGSIERFYNARAFDASNSVLAEVFNIAVTDAAEFIGFKSDVAEIARIELNFGPTFGTGQRPFIDTIAYAGEAVVTPVPLPAALPFLIGALGLLGMFGRRGRHKVAAASSHRVSYTGTEIRFPQTQRAFRSHARLAKDYSRSPDAIFGT